MKKSRVSASMNFASILQVDVPKGRTGKHHLIVAKILSDLAQLEPGRAIRIPLSELSDSKENVRSALNRASRTKGTALSTASDEEFLYVWRLADSIVENGKQAAVR